MRISHPRLLSTLLCVATADVVSARRFAEFFAQHANYYKGGGGGESSSVPVYPSTDASLLEYDNNNNRGGAEFGAFKGSSSTIGGENGGDPSSEGPGGEGGSARNMMRMKKSTTSSPTSFPTSSPTSSPTRTPTGAPTDSPTMVPTVAPTAPECTSMMVYYKTEQVFDGLNATSTGNTFDFPFYASPDADDANGDNNGTQSMEPIGKYNDAATILPDDCVYIASYSFYADNQTSSYDSQIAITSTCETPTNVIAGGSGMYACASGTEQNFVDVGIEGYRASILTLCGGTCDPSTVTTSTR